MVKKWYFYDRSVVNNNQNNLLKDKKEIYSGNIMNIDDLKSMLLLLLKQIKEESKFEGKIDIAIRMKEKGYKIKDISDVTGLTIKRIKVL